MGEIADYETFLDELDRVWRECSRVLVPGGRISCVVGDVCIPRKKGGRHYVLPLHADIQVRARGIGLDCLKPILSTKVANGANEAEGNGAGFRQAISTRAIIKNDVEYILFMRKGGEYRKPQPVAKMLWMMNRAKCGFGSIRGGLTCPAPPAKWSPGTVPARDRTALDQANFLCG